MFDADFLIVGAGIAGASIAYQLKGCGSVILLEMEDQAGYHTTGRSAAFYAETYGGPLIQPLTTASKDFFYNQPAGFANTNILSPLGALHTYTHLQADDAHKHYDVLVKTLPTVELWEASQVCDRVPVLDAKQVAGGIYDPDCGALDVATLHDGYLRAAAKAGVQLHLGKGLESAVYDGQGWHVETKAGSLYAKVLVNAAGAWGDVVAEKAGVMPVGLQPLKRTLITVPNPESKQFDPKSPLVLNMQETCYFKPEGAGYLVCPADETLSPPCDAQPDTDEIALAAHRFELETGTAVKKILSKWAGLRTFAPDRLPVIGYAPDQAAFFWSVGQGGYGIQTAPAWSSLAVSALLGTPISDTLLTAGVHPDKYSPYRFLEKPEAT